MGTPLFILLGQETEDAAMPISVLELQSRKNISMASSSSINTTFKGNMPFISSCYKLGRCNLTAL